jgi:hypothetical protein
LKIQLIDNNKHSKLGKGSKLINRDTKLMQISSKTFDLLCNYSRKNSTSETGPLTYDEIIESLYNIWVEKQREELQNRYFNYSRI